MNTSVGKVGINMQRASGGMIILCWITILLCTVLKFFGYREFEIPAFNVTINIWLHRFINLVLYNINIVLVMFILLKRKLKFKEFLITIGVYTVLFIISLFESLAVALFILEPIFWFVLYFLFVKDKWYRHLIEVIVVYVLVFIYQALTMLY